MAKIARKARKGKKGIKSSESHSSHVPFSYLYSMKINKAPLLKVSESRPVTLRNGAKFYPICRGNIPALKLELTFPAGRPFEHKAGIASATLQLLKGGTKLKSATKLAEGFDYWGSSINFDFYIDTVGIKLFALEKYLPNVLPLLVELLSEPKFPESEIKLYKRQQKEKLKSDESRGDVVAYRSFTENIFGSKHPYGYNSTIESIDSFTREDLLSHFQKGYNMNECKIFLSGNFRDQTTNLVMNLMGGISSTNYTSAILEFPSSASPKRYWHIPKSDSIQTSVRIGRTMFTRNHPEYTPVFVLNTILGGYFGSRLMQNLREKKGLTYHIYSSLDTFLLDGYFLISTEVDNERYKVAVKGIYDELDKLKQKAVSARELNSIKNYLRGSFLNYFENAFGYSELIRMLSLEGGAKAFDELVLGIEYIQAGEILDVAQKYLGENDLTEITVGKI